MPGTSSDVLVIGGGAAGMMAALSAAQQGASAVLLERNEKLGRKLNITGKGRCNLTNNCSAQEALANVPRNGRFLFSAFSRFDCRAAMAFFEELGVPLKTERGNRVFPVSDCAYDVTDALRAALRRAHVRLVHDRAREVLTDEAGAVCGARGEKGNYPCAAIILATGGVSYPATGSTGDGYAMAQAVGHTVVPPRPSLISLVCAEDCCARMQGLPLRNAALKVKDCKNKTVYENFGEMLFTDQGVSGPMILSASAHLRALGREQYRLQLDLKPALNEEKLERRILRDLGEQSNREMATVLGGLVPRSMIPVLLERAEIGGHEKANSLTRQQRRRLLALLKCFELTAIAPGPIEQAIVTSGGVDTREIQPATMESKKVPGLYFAGEVIDVDAYTGGFNLQIAWATGRTAGFAAAQRIRSKK